MTLENQYYWMKHRQRPCTCLADVGELEGRRLSMFDAAMPMDYFVRKLPRKWWEWDYIAGCAELLGLLRPDTTALGLGVGFEPLMFHFANSCGKVIATDLYSSGTAWSEARFQTLNEVIASAPIPFPHERLSIRNADMRHTGVDAGSIDLIWSCSSIEHVPTLKDLFAVFSEINRALKIGGHAILTTEYCITGNSYLLPGVNAWNRQLIDAVRSALRGFEFLGPIDLSFNGFHTGNAARPRRYLPVSSMPASSSHLSYYHRAGTVANPVGLSIIVPIAFVLRKTSKAGVAIWSEADIPRRLRTYSEGLSAFFDGRNEEAICLLEEAYQSTDDDLQLKHHAFRFLTDAKARSGHMEQQEVFVAGILEFLSCLPRDPCRMPMFSTYALTWSASAAGSINRSTSMRNV